MANALKLEGLWDLKVGFSTASGKITSSAVQGLKRVGQSIVNDAKINLKNNESVVTNNLRQSGKVQVLDGGEVDAGFFTEGEGYAYFVEYGRRAGKPAPVAHIEAWLKKKTSVSRGIKSAFSSASVFMSSSPEKFRRALAFAISRAIGKKGTKPHPFFVPAIKSNQADAERVVAEAIKKTIR